MAEQQNKKIKQAQELLQQSEQRYKTIFQNTAEGIIIVDIETKKFKHVNPAICKLLGYSQKELEQMGVPDIHLKEHLEDVLAAIEIQIQGEKPFAADIPCLRKDGTIVYANINAGKIIIDRKEYLVGFFSDITEYKRIKQALKNSEERIFKAQRYAYIDSMGTIVAHQLNQPLTVINMLLGRALELEQGQGDCCSLAFKNIRESLAEAQKAAWIIRKFRRYSKTPAPETVKKIRIGAVANRIVSVLNEKAKQIKMDIFIENLENIPDVNFNETALEQIFLVIMQNAIEAADGSKQHELRITGKFTGQNIELEFSDDCDGISPENIDKIFEPFFSTKAGKGMGLGLEIVQHLLTGIGGEIRVKSQLGKGTTFYVTLPVNNN